MRLTYWNADQEAYEVRIHEDSKLILRTCGEEHLNNGVIVSPVMHFVSGFIIDALAEYENTGLTPNEIKKLKESNKILRQNNDEYYREYQKLLDENYKLKCLLKTCKTLLESGT